MNTKRIFTLFVLFLVFKAISLNAQYDDDSILYWTKNRLLKWSDFQGKVPINCGNTKAISTPNIKSINYFRNGKIKNIKILCYFEMNNSWTKDTTALLLEHEQVHFNLAEVYARKIRKAFSLLKAQNKDNFEIYNDTIKNMLFENHKRQTEYDYETKHGTDSKQQDKWNKQISKELELLKDYEVDYSEY